MEVLDYPGSSLVSLSSARVWYLIKKLAVSLLWDLEHEMNISCRLCECDNHFIACFVDQWQCSYKFNTLTCQPTIAFSSTGRKRNLSLVCSRHCCLTFSKTGTEFRFWQSWLKIRRIQSSYVSYEILSHKLWILIVKVTVENVKK